MVTILPFLCCPPKDMGLDYTMSLIVLPTLLWFRLYTVVRYICR